MIDAHVHFNEPGRADWEGFETGTRALAAGGATAAIDMPLNAHPPTVTGAAFDEKRRCLERSALVDIALWGGLVPGGIEAMDELAARGVVGFKAFMCTSGIDDFPGVDDLTLYEGMCRAASLGLPVAVHAESEAITAGLAQRARAAGRTAMRDFLASRPAVAELQAIARAIALAQESGCSTARRSRLDRPRRRAGGRRSRARRGRQLRDLPALPGAHRGGRRGARQRREVRAAVAPARRRARRCGARSPTARCRWSHRTTRRRPGR